MIRSLLIVALLCGSGSDALLADVRPLELMDVFALEYASDPRLSPDGERIVYVRNSMDIQKDRGRRQLWIMDAEGASHRPLTGNWGESSPRWSPDGQRIAYVARDPESEKAQIFIYWLETRTTTAVTQLLEGPGSISWSPDGASIAFTSRVPEEPGPSLIDMPSPPKGAEWAEPARVIEELVYRSDGGGYVTPSNTHVFRVPASGGTPEQLTTGEFDFGGPLAWMPDGESVVLSVDMKPNREFIRDPEIYRLDLATGKLTQLTDRRGPDGSPAVSPDGKWVAYTGHDDRFQGYQISHLYLMRSDGSEVRTLTRRFDRSVGSPRWADHGSGVLVQYDSEGKGAVAFVSLDGIVSELVLDRGGTSTGRPYGGGSFHARGERVVYCRCSASDLSNVALWEKGASGVRPLTALNDDLFGQRDLAKVEELWTEAPDGKRVHSWFMTPPGYDGKSALPLVLEIHGGPFANYGPRFAMELQLFAARGYGVLYVNPRGSSSYGAEFGNLIHHAYPGDDYGDLMAAVDAVIETKNIDTSRLFVTGGSGGGVLTAWIVGKTDRFRAAVVAKPVINWFSFVLTADAYPFFTKYWFPAMPWEDPEHYFRRSPISLVGNVTTPTMLLTGEEDFRTPMSESEQYYQALALRKVPTALVRIPGASHGIARRPSQLMAKVAAILGWFERHDANAEGSGN